MVDLAAHVAYRVPCRHGFSSVCFAGGDRLVTLRKEGDGHALSAVGLP